MSPINFRHVGNSIEFTICVGIKYHLWLGFRVPSLLEIKVQLGCRFLPSYAHMKRVHITLSQRCKFAPLRVHTSWGANLHPCQSYMNSDKSLWSYIATFSRKLMLHFSPVSRNKEIMKRENKQTNKNMKIKMLIWTNLTRKQQKINK